MSTRSLLFSRIRDIKSSISRINLKKSSVDLANSGDELKEISDFCYLIDEKLKQEHQNLEKAIRESTPRTSIKQQKTLKKPIESWNNLTAPNQNSSQIFPMN